jgi:hypothetical protein
MNLDKGYKPSQVAAFQSIISGRRECDIKGSYPHKPMSDAEWPNKEVQLKPAKIGGDRKKDSHKNYHQSSPKIQII